MHKLLIAIIPALLLTACGDGGADPVTVVGNGQEPCAKKECISPSDVKDKR